MAERKFVGVKVGANGVAWLDRVALDATTSRSHVIRAALIVAKRHERELRDLLRSNQ